MGLDDNLLRALDRLVRSRPARWCAHAANETLNLLLPVSCAVCARPDRRLCAQCRKAVARQLHLPPLPEQQLIQLELPALQREIPVAASGIYANELARAVLAYKDHQRFFLARTFAPYLAASLNAMASGVSCGRRRAAPLLLVPMPSSLKAVGRRGYRPVEAMVQAAARAGMLAPEVRLSRILHYRAAQVLGGAQKGRSGSDRRGRKVRLVAERPRLRGQRIVLVDDVLTTGSTLQHAAITCAGAGYEVIGAVVLALTRAPGATPSAELCSAR